MRVGQKAHVKDVIGIDRNTVLEAEGFEDHRQFTLAFTQQSGTQHLGQLMHRHFRRIDDQIGAGAQGLQQIALFVDGAFQRQILAGERVQATGIAVPAVNIVRFILLNNWLTTSARAARTCSLVIGRWKNVNHDRKADR